MIEITSYFESIITTFLDRQQQCKSASWDVSE